MSHGHSHGPSAPTGPQVAVGTNDEMINLQPFVDVRNSQVLNADPKTNLASVLSVTEGVLRSDADIDPELILVVNFTEAVRLRGLKLKATEAKSDGDADASGPLVVKIFRERPHHGFAECQDEKPTEQVTLTKQQLESGEEIRLKFALFQNVTSYAEQTGRTPSLAHRGSSLEWCATWC